MFSSRLRVLNIAAGLGLIDEQAFNVSQQFPRQALLDFDFSDDQSVCLAPFIDAIPSRRFRAVASSPAD